MKRLACGALIFATAVLVSVMAGPAQAKVPGPNGLIVFTRSDFSTGTDATFTANPDGSNVRPLFPAFGSSNPHWSPDGQLVAVVSGLDVPCPPTCTGNTVIINPDTGQYRVLPSQGFPAVSTFCSIWSPDATHFACDGENDNDPSVNGVYTIRSADGGGLTRITTASGSGDDLPIDYSPDGRQLVFGHTGPFHQCDKTSALYVVNIDGSGLNRITPWGFCDDDGTWSPDGSRIAFVLDDGRIFTVHPDGTGLAQLPLGPVPGASNSRTFAGDVSWSPDGRQIAMLLTVKTGTGSYQTGIATADRNGNNVRWVTTSPLFDHEADWGPHPLVP